MLKALGDETRFSMYRELAASTRGCSAQDLADSLGLHANTVRLHLDRLREAGLVDVEAVRAARDASFTGGDVPPIAIDNTFLGPLWAKPLAQGADGKILLATLDAFAQPLTVAEATTQLGAKAKLDPGSARAAIDSLVHARLLQPA